MRALLGDETSRGQHATLGRLRLLAAAVTLLAPAPAEPQTHPSRSAPCPSLPAGSVPAPGWDCVPTWLRRDSTYRAHGHAPEVIVVHFTADISKTERAGAVAQIGGTVLGAQPMGGFGDFYYIHVPEALTFEELRAACASVKSRSSGVWCSVVRPARPALLNAPSWPPNQHLQLAAARWLRQAAGPAVCSLSTVRAAWRQRGRS